MFLENELKKRGIPDINGEKINSKEQWRKLRKQIINILCNEEYGFMPSDPIDMTAELISKKENFCGGKVTMSKISLKLKLEKGEFSFPIYCSVPNYGNKAYPAFVYICFRENIQYKYMIEEICDNGFAVFSFNYKDVVADKDDGFSQGLAKVLYDNGKRKDNDAGKIAMWAWAASRVMDYIQTLDVIDKNNVAVIGHSRLGKTALLAGGLDERFSYVISNDSGCSGAAITRKKTGERVKNIYNSFPHWFCKNYKKYIDNEQKLPFDQHYLLALSAPRKVYVASAHKDTWADPNSEYLSCVAASNVFELLGVKGFIRPDRYPNPTDVFNEGNIAYHLRSGTHYLSRWDWQNFMNYINKNLKE